MPRITNIFRERGLVETKAQFCGAEMALDGFEVMSICSSPFTLDQILLEELFLYLPSNTHRQHFYFGSLPVNWILNEGCTLPRDKFSSYLDRDLRSKMPKITSGALWVPTIHSILIF